MTTRVRLSIDDIKRAANARMFDVLRALGVNEQPSRGGYISMCNPMRKDRSPSFTIFTRNGFVAWKDHTDDGPGGTRGDIIDLVAYLKGWWHLPKKGRAEALRWLCETLRLEIVSPEQLARDRELSRRVQAEIVKKAEEDLAQRQGRAMELFLKAGPLPGSVPEIYLRDARGIDLASLPRGPRGGLRWPSVLRAFAQHEHRWENNRDKTDPRNGTRSVHPCMIAGCVDYSLPVPAIKAVHRTWLHADGSGKAAVIPQRKVFPDFRGLVIPLWTGESNLSVREAIEAGLRETLVLCEGIETGLTAVLARPELRVWAVISLGNLGNVPIPECIDGVIVHRENDWHAPQAGRSFDAAVARIEQQGVPVVEAGALSGSDWNDTWRGEE